MKGWLALAALAALALAYSAGWYRGNEQAALAAKAATAQAMAQAIRNAEIASRIEAERLAIEAERNALAQELEDQAYADTDDAGGLPRSRVDRLRRR